MLHKSNGYYFTDKYYPKYKKIMVDFAKEQFREQIYQFKDGNVKYIEYFAETLHYHINEIFKLANKPFGEPINLVAVPSSKVSKKVPMRLAINEIIKLAQKTPEINRLNLVNYGPLLVRVTDVRTGHRSYTRPVKDDHLASIGINKYVDADSLKSTPGIFIILDDITTTGASFDACKVILHRQGISVDRIYCLAIGKTV